MPSGCWDAAARMPCFFNKVRVMHNKFCDQLFPFLWKLSLQLPHIVDDLGNPREHLLTLWANSGVQKCKQSVRAMPAQPAYV
eukprot:7584484-Karenia_brevis.AAC.1